MANPNEPTHTDADGKDRPGSASLKQVINPSTARAAEAAWDENYTDLNLRKRKSAQAPNISQPYADLDDMITKAIQRFGNMSAQTVQGDVRLMMVGYANVIIEELRAHPYFSIPDLDYYISLNDKRPIPDEIMIAGLTYYYADWNDSNKAAKFGRAYYKNMNTILYQRKFGTGKIEMNTVDKDEVNHSYGKPEQPLTS